MAGEGVIMMRTVAILGGGKIGRALKTLLVDLSSIGNVTVADAVLDEGIDVELDVSDQGIDALREVVRAHDAVVSALPFHLNKDVATVCAAEGKSYFDFTEDTDTT